MMKLLNILFCLLILITTINVVSAVTVIKNIPDTSDKTVVGYDVTDVYTTYVTTSTDEIDRIKVGFQIPSGNSQNALRMDFPNNVTYLVRTVRYFSISTECIGWCIRVNELIYIQNVSTTYEIFNVSKSLNLLSSNAISVDYSYDISSKKTKVTLAHGSSLDNLINVFVSVNESTSDFETPLNVGLPAGTFTLSTQSPFSNGALTGTHVDITIMDRAGATALKQQVEGLSWISGILYGIFTLHINILGIDIHLLGENILLLNLLMIFDTMVAIILGIFKLMFVYPYLILVWVVTIGNFFVSWSSTTMREMIFNYRDYVMWLIHTTAKVLTWIYASIMRLIVALTTWIP